jgi:hypothetical protein
MAKHSKQGEAASESSSESGSEKPPGKLGYKVLAGAGAAVGTTVANKALEGTWKKVTGKEPPTNPENPDVRWREAAVWAGASAAIVAIARLVAQRRVAATWRRASGELPPGVD